LVPGYEIVGRVTAVGSGVLSFAVGDRVGVPWLGWTCGNCAFCSSGAENLCDQARVTGYTLDGGSAEYVVADHRFYLTIPDAYRDVEAAPLLCAGLIGYRCYVKTGNPRRLGIYGFGAAAHIAAQLGS
jgi:propanol-preferring alcohol dehydrogenase